MRRAWLIKRIPYDVADYEQHPDSSPAATASEDCISREVPSGSTTTGGSSGVDSASTDATATAAKVSSAGTAPEARAPPIGDSSAGISSSPESSTPAAVTLTLAGIDPTSAPKWPDYGSPPHQLCCAVKSGPPPAADRLAQIIAADVAAKTVTVHLPRLRDEDLRLLQKHLTDHTVTMQAQLHTVLESCLCSRFKLESAALDCSVPLPEHMQHLQLENLLFTLPEEARCAYCFVTNTFATQTYTCICHSESF